jgi:hypothetical protein
MPRPLIWHVSKTLNGMTHKVTTNVIKHSCTEIPIIT